MEQRKLKLGDLYAATFLDLHGVHPDFDVIRDKTLFIFPVSDQTYKLLSEYNSGASCPASDFVEHMKSLRARMMDLKRGGGSR